MSGPELGLPAAYRQGELRTAALTCPLVEARCSHVLLSAPGLQRRCQKGASVPPSHTPPGMSPCRPGLLPVASSVASATWAGGKLRAMWWLSYPCGLQELPQRQWGTLEPLRDACLLRKRMARASRREQLAPGLQDVTSREGAKAAQPHGPAPRTSSGWGVVGPPPHRAGALG